MNINRLIHAYVTEGGCWHEWKDTYDTNGHTVSTAPTLRCKHCGTAKFMSDNPDYSTPDNFKVLLDKLFTDVIGEAFYDWATSYAYRNNEIEEYTEWNMIKWIFSDYSRFCTLFAEFLALPETVEEFGWTPCDGFPECMQGERDICKYPDQRCEGNGKVRGQYSAWARMIQDEE